MPRPNPDLTGQSFGALTVLAMAPRVYRPDGSMERVRWVTKCACGNEKIIYGRRLQTGRTKSCGCKQFAWRHGLSGTPAHRSWLSMIQRCTNPNRPRFKDWGGRGIKVCERWLASFENFLADMGERPAGTTLDRKDNDGHYEPGNCRWATRREQAINTRKRTATPAMLG